MKINQNNDDYLVLAWDNIIKSLNTFELRIFDYLRERVIVRGLKAGRSRMYKAAVVPASDSEYQTLIDKYKEQRDAIIKVV